MYFLYYQIFDKIIKWLCFNFLRCFVHYNKVWTENVIMTFTFDLLTQTLQVSSFPPGWELFQVIVLERNVDRFCPFWPWHFYPKNYKWHSFFVIHLCIKVAPLTIRCVILFPKIIGIIFLSLSSICVWHMTFLVSKLSKFSHLNYISITLIDQFPPKHLPVGVFLNKCIK